MQLHVHSQIAHVARTLIDGKWRAPDSLGYNEHVGAVAAIVSQHLEEALTARFGLEWTARDDGHGFEIKGISGEMMRLFSSCRESITAEVRTRAAQFEQHNGRAPSQRELARLAQASNLIRVAGSRWAVEVGHRCYLSSGICLSRLPSLSFFPATPVPGPAMSLPATRLRTHLSAS